MRSALMKCWLVFVLTVSCAKPLSAAQPSAAVTVTAAATTTCGENELICFRLALLDKQEEVISLGKRLGLREKEIQLLQDTGKLTSEYLQSVLVSNRSLLDAANKLAPRWYESPILWGIVGVIVGAGLTVLAVWGAGQLLAARY